MAEETKAHAQVREDEKQAQKREDERQAKLGAKSDTKAEKKEQTPEEKLNEENEKKNKARTEAVDKAVKDVLAVAEQQNEDPQSILDELKGRIASVATVAAGAQFGPTPEKISELTEKHTPYIYPNEVVEKGNVVFSNIMEHEPYLETAGPTKKAPAPATSSHAIAGK